MSSNLVDTAKSLPLTERVELVNALWESIAQEGYEPTLTQAQALELDRRLEDHHRDPNDVVSWEAIKQDLHDQYPHR
jgi:putative addiction module component (TIGR02574 family)